MARPRPATRSTTLAYAGDDTFAEQMKTLEIAGSVEGVRHRIAEAVTARRLVSPTELLGEIVGPEKQEEEDPEDPETVQAFAMNFLALWNEEVSRLPPGEEAEAWRASVQGMIEAEAKEAQKPYVAKPHPGRNDPCSCGSGKKYKKCCGA